MPNLLAIKNKYGIIGNYDGLNSALDIALRVAGSNATVLILGENGTGKEVFPRIIHDASSRSSKPYMAVNCGAIPEGTIDSELFGHVKGAYTGAIESREGYFGAARGGTLFLDEVGELPMATQARLLRVLETGEYIPVGSSKVERTDVRVIAATNVNIPEAIRRGKFRQDLYYRLNIITVQVPPLRDRGRDAELLFRYFASEMQGRYGMNPIRLTPEAASMLCTYSWPGNVRQLRNLVESMSLTSDERQITPEILRSYLPQEPAGRRLTVAGERREGQYSYDQEREIIFQMLISLRREVEELRQQLHPGTSADTLALPQKGLLPSPSDTMDEIVELTSEEPQTKADAEREVMRRALERNGGHRAAAARECGMAERTFYRKIKEYGLDKL